MTLSRVTQGAARLSEPVYTFGRPGLTEQSRRQGKARAAIVFGMATREVADAAAAGKPVSITVTPAGAGAGEVTVQQGGIPIMRAGKVVGGVGVGGSAPASDEKFAQAGVEAAK